MKQIKIMNVVVMLLNSELLMFLVFFRNLKEMNKLSEVNFFWQAHDILEHLDPESHALWTYLETSQVKRIR